MPRARTLHHAVCRFRLPERDRNVLHDFTLQPRTGHLPGCQRSTLADRAASSVVRSGFAPTCSRTPLKPSRGLRPVAIERPLNLLQPLRPDALHAREGVVVLRPLELLHGQNVGAFFCYT